MVKQHRALTNPTFENVRELHSDYIRARRAVDGFTEGKEQLLRYDERFGVMNMRNAEDAVRACRKHVFGDTFGDAPLCPIEKDIAAQKVGSAWVLLVGYEVVAKAIERELSELTRAQSAVAMPPAPQGRADTPPAIAREDVKRAFGAGTAPAVARPIRRSRSNG